jgi:hypothetical protein
MENGRDDRFHRLPVIPVDVQPVINPNQIVSARLRSNRATPCGMATVSVKRTAFAAVLVCLMRTFAFSQGGPDPDRVKVHVGPVMLSPTITFGNIGYDENVFDEATDPKRDFTVTASPKTEWWLPFMGTWFSGVVNEDLVWYQRYASERGTNTTLGVNWKAPTSRMTVDVGARRARLSDRLNFEIDARPDRLQRSYSASLALHVLPDTAIEISANKDEIDFDDDELYNGVNLHDQLNRDVTTIRVGASQNLTPLTKVRLTVARQRDRFPVDFTRDMDATHSTAAVTFDPQALLRGAFSFSYTRFTPLSATVPSYSGATFGGELSYTLLEVTRFRFAAQRGLEYSYETFQPYYVQTAVNVEVAQQLFGPVDVVARAGAAQLAYRTQVGADVAVPDRTDKIRSFGGGVGYHLGRNLRLGFNADSVRRQSAISSLQYERPTYGGSVTYEF